MAKLSNVITVPVAQEGVVVRGLAAPAASAPAAVAGVPMQVLNATPFSLQSVVLNGGTLNGTPSAGLAAGETLVALNGTLQAGSNNPLTVSFDGRGWSANLDPPGGPPRQVTLLCFWNGCVLLDYNGLMRTIIWE
jgi:hypothetical protein